VGNDSYHTDCLAAQDAASKGSARPNFIANYLKAQRATAADKDPNNAVNRQEWPAVADNWFQKLDTGHTGTVNRADLWRTSNADYALSYIPRVRTARVL
jgi:hypothetical protein